MSKAVYGVPLQGGEGETVTLSTSAQYLALKPGFREVKMYCASQWRLALNPKLVHAVVYTAAGGYVEYVQSVIDRASTTHMPLDGLLAASGIVYLGTKEPVRGYYFDVGTNVNAETATLDVEYCSTAVALGVAIAFTDVASDTDGTDATGTSTGATLGQDGAYTFTLPAVKESTLGTYATPLYSKCYWTRFKPSANLSAEVDINEIIPIYKNTNYMYMEPGQEYQFSIDLERTSGFAVLATAGTPTLDVSWINH